MPPLVDAIWLEYVKNRETMSTLELAKRLADVHHAHIARNGHE